MTTVADLIQHALDQKPAETQQALHDLMLDKIRDKLEAKRVEMANKFYNVSGEQPEEAEASADDEAEYESGESDEEEQEYEESEEDSEDEETQ